MRNRFGVALHPDSVRWAAAEGVTEDVIAAVLLLHERCVEEIVPQLSPLELEKVIELVGRSPRLYPRGILEALDQHKSSPASAPIAQSVPPNPSSKEEATPSARAAHPPRSDAQPSSRTGPDGRQSPANSGWAGYGDWLGTGAVATRLHRYRSFKKARAFVRRLNLKSGAEWRDYSKSGKKPDDISADPGQTYAEAGWAGMGDWLGTGRVAPGQYRSFKEARALVRSVGLKSQAEWTSYGRSGKKPADIPADPYKVYANDGWAGYGDWLGYVRSGR
jgi:hypothetical protein